MNRTEAREKATALVAQMTIEEAASQLLHSSPAIPRLGIPAYDWWSEALHGVARAGTATCYPQAIGLGATFDRDLLQKIAELTVNEPPQVSESIKKSVSSGISYGSARAAAISEYLQNQNLTGYTSADLDRILASPNNILAIEYIAALIQTDSRIKPVRSEGSYQNTTALPPTTTSVRPQPYVSCSGQVMLKA